MILILLLLATFFLCAWVLMRWRRVKRYWLERGVPHYSPHPIFGNLTFLQRENPAVWMRQVYKDFKVPYVGIWLFWRPALVINSPEIARRVLVKDADVFKNRLMSSGKTDPIGAVNIVTANDSVWTETRRRLTFVFTAAKMRSVNRIIVTKASNLIARIERETAMDERIDLRKVFADYTTDVISESGFGVTSNSLIEGDSIMRKITRELATFNLYRGLSWSCIFFIPELVDVFRFTLFPKDTIGLLRKVFRTMVEQRGGYEKEIKDPRDLLDALMKIKQEAVADGKEMSEDFLIAQAAVFLQGGFDNSAAAMAWTAYELAWHPQYQKRLYEELVEAKRKIGDQDFNPSELSELTYLNCVIKETFRTYPPMGWLDRVASKDYQIDDKLTIRAGTAVYVNGVGMQTDPEYFPNPKEYIPDRFLPENERSMTPYTFMPFGEGPRGCIGVRFAYQTVQQGLANVFLNYEAKVLPNTPKPKDCVVEKNGLFLLPGEKMSVQFVRRENEWSSLVNLK